MNSIEYSEAKSPDGTEANQTPVGLRRISEKEFAQSQYFIYAPVLMDYRQVIIPKDHSMIADCGKMIPLHMVWFKDGTGLAMTNDYWNGKIEYFAFGCQHDYRELSARQCMERGISHHGMCWHVMECSKCKHINSYDSSD